MPFQTFKLGSKKGKTKISAFLILMEGLIGKKSDDTEKESAPIKLNRLLTKGDSEQTEW